MGCVYKPTRQEGDRRVKYQCYRIAFVDEHGRRVTEKAFRDKKASEELLRKREREVERRRAGLLVVRESDTSRKWPDVIELFCAELISRGSEPGGKHESEARRILTAVGEACNWSQIREARADGFRTYLADLTEAGRAPQTRKHHLALTRNFLNYCVAQGWLAENPIAQVKAPRTGQAGKVHRRRAFTSDELRHLLAKTPEPRRTVYLVAALSGYRRAELGRMEKRDLTPEGPHPRWHLRAEASKGSRMGIKDLAEAAWKLPPIFSMPATGSAPTGANRAEESGTCGA